MESFTDAEKAHLREARPLNMPQDITSDIAAKAMAVDRQTAYKFAPDFARTTSKRFNNPKILPRVTADVTF
jgi:hypothetical protein